MEQWRSTEATHCSAHTASNTVAAAGAPGQVNLATERASRHAGTQACRNAGTQERRHAQECGVIEVLFAATYVCDASMCHLHPKQQRGTEQTAGRESLRTSVVCIGLVGHGRRLSGGEVTVFQVSSGPARSAGIYYLSKPVSAHATHNSSANAVL